jgi:hypothetical protein
MVTISKRQALELIRRAGFTEQAERLALELPDPLDVDRDGEWLLEKYGITRTKLMEALGSSP